ncbi:uncharacterized protein G2W53_026259 [Senna tora]|uniref:Uncharacterized protein n=1 Tax=Senna tora TaxID=362788 RepID=A0A834WL28_9FABA|nr:uncharacterized protein G2W53_026259 [Senna tora]
MSCPIKSLMMPDLPAAVGQHIWWKTIVYT